MPNRIYEFRKDRYIWISSEIWIYYSISGLSYRISKWYQNLSVFQFRSRKQRKQIATVTERVNVFHCKITLECHFHPRKRLLSVIPVALLHSAYTIANSICCRMWRWKYRGAKKVEVRNCNGPLSPEAKIKLRKRRCRRKTIWVSRVRLSFDGKRYLRKEYFISFDWNLNRNAQEVFFNSAYPYTAPYIFPKQ